MRLLSLTLALAVLGLWVGCTGNEGSGAGQGDADTDTDSDSDNDNDDDDDDDSNSDDDDDDSNSDDDDDNNDDDEGIAVLMEICQGLVEQKFTSKCGTQKDPCDENHGNECIQLYGEDILLGPNEHVNSSTEPIPRDLEALFGKIEFLPDDAVDAITDEDEIIWGDPENEGEPYLEIYRGEWFYMIDSGQTSNGIAPEDEAFEESDYIDDVRKFFEPMGIDPEQAMPRVLAFMSDTVDDDGNVVSTLEMRMVHVYRGINQISTVDRVVFLYSPDDRLLLEIEGEWPELNYEDSQFTLKHDTIDDTVAAVMEQLEEFEVDSVDTMNLFYYPDEDSMDVLDLVLEVSTENAIFDIDI